ncbi:MAG: hypothetical protein HRU09_16580 [Oligoflexales bacterium]|nr:hypothetical protein [Oligoflexales bacterium]
MRIKSYISSLWALGFLSPHASAFVPKHIPKHMAPQELDPIIRPSFAESSEKSLILTGFDSIKKDSLSGSLRVLSGKQEEYSLAPETTLEGFVKNIKKFIDNHQDVFGVSSKALVLESDASLRTEEESFLKFRVQYNGILVQDSSIDFRYKKGSLIQVVNHSFSEAKKTTAKPASDLLNKANEVFEGGKIKEGPLLYRVSQEDSGYALKLVRQFEVETEGQGSFTLELDGETGKVYSLIDNHLHYSASVNGSVHARWYKQNIETVPVKHLKVNTERGAQYTDAQGNVEQGGSRAPTLKGIKGQYVNIYNYTGPSISEQADLKNGSWILDIDSEQSQEAWNNKYTSQLMVYHHTNAVVNKAKQYIESRWLTSNLRANVNLRKTCNAHWDGRTINFYSGNKKCANTGLLADVIYHEWGHGLDAKTGGIRDRAFSEGFGDIIALVMTGSPQLGVGFFVESGAGVRDMSVPKVYPKDRGEIHAEGLIIASTFWDLFLAFKEKYGEEKANEIIANYAFKMIFTADRYTEVYDALLAIDDNDGDLNNGTPHLCLLNSIFKDHGLAKQDNRCS